MPAERPDLMPKVRALPHKPGVYIYRDRLNRVIYVGKAKDLRKRVGQYFRPSYRSMMDPKTRALLAGIWDLETHTVRSDAEAVVLESRLIKEYRPKYNVSFRDDKQLLLVKVNLADPFPQFKFTRHREDDGCRYFGPFAYAGPLRATINLMKRKFGLRSCLPPVPTEKDFKHCLDHVIKNCSAPCVGKVTRAEYLARVRQACDFLASKSAEMTAVLEAEMRQQAAALNFEKAAELRNLLDHIRRTTEPARRLRFRSELPGTRSPESEMQELRDALQLAALPERIECFDISNISVTHKVASMVCYLNAKPVPRLYRRYQIRTVAGQDDYACMAEVIRRCYRRRLNEKQKMPDLIVVDGGKGQLGAALAELNKLELLGQPIVGLAKKNEEIFLPARADPLVLPRDSGALRLLQRIRDSAHRVANGYHRILLNKRVSVSLLDDCPGIGTARKQALLKHFGNIENIRRATPKKLSAVDGISPAIAKKIAAFFRDPTVSEEPAPGEVFYELKGLPTARRR